MTRAQVRQCEPRRSTQTKQDACAHAGARVPATAAGGPGFLSPVAGVFVVLTHARQYTADGNLIE